METGNEQTQTERLIIQGALERRILHGLSCEWDNAIGGLDHSLRERCLKPAFSLKNMKNRWGYWNREKRLICLSRNLVLDHSWDCAKEILLHEMAHQIAEEVLGSDKEPPHGPAFQRACNLLRANPEASGKYPLLDERVSGDAVRTEDKIMLRVKKLMALAQSNNRHEAEVAMAKAHEIIEKYNVDLLEKDAAREFVSVFLGRPALRHSREHYHLSALLQEFYFVFCF